MRVGPSLPAVLAAWSSVVGWLVCDFHRVGPGLFRVLVVCGAFGVGAAVGAGLAAESVRASRLRSAAVLVVVLPMLSCLAGLGAAFVEDDGYGYQMYLQRDAAVTGFCAGLAALPAVWLMSRAAERVDRARPGSVLHEIDRRALWTLPCATIAVGAAFAFAGNPQLVSFHGEMPSGLGIGTIATLGLMVTFVLEASSARFAAAVRRSAADLRQREGWVDPTIPVLDLGVGDQELEYHRPGRAAYRSAGGAELLVRGDPLVALRGARLAALRTGAALIASAAATAWTLSGFPPR